MYRRKFLTLSVKTAMAAGLTAAVPATLLRSQSSHGALLAAGLSDPLAQPLFRYPAANAMSAAFKYVVPSNKISIDMAQPLQEPHPGLVPHIKPLELGKTAKADLVEFLNSLSGSNAQALARDGRSQAYWRLSCRQGTYSAQ